MPRCLTSSWSNAIANQEDEDPQKTVTTRQGHPVTNNQSQRTVGSRGPATGSVPNHRATAEEVLGGMMTEPIK